LSAAEVDHAIRDDDVDRVVGKGDLLDFALQELDVRRSGLLLVLSGKREHFVGHVQTVGLAGRAHALCRQENVDSASRAQVEHRLAGSEMSKGGRVPASQGGLDRRLGKLGLFHDRRRGHR
jgi:hypothetical protein